MSEPEEAHYAASPLDQPRKVRLWVRKLPYIAVLALTILGVAYTSVSRQPLIGYWVFLAVATGLLCVTMGWLNNHDSKARFRMVWSQALHWLVLGRDEHSALTRCSKNADFGCDGIRTSSAAGTWHFCRGGPRILADLRSRPHHGALR